MKTTCYKIVPAFALLPLMMAGCASQLVQNGASAEAVTPVASTPQVQAVAPHAARPAQQMRSPSALETRYGIQIVQLGLAASGGLVDLRFKVLDAVKVKALLGDPANAPMLVAGDKPPLMAPHNALRGAKFGQGQVVYILYPNLRSAIKPGVEVTVVMGEARLGPVTAQ